MHNIMMMSRRISVFYLTLLLTAFCHAQRELDCVEGDIRLVGGQGPYEGTVQLCISGEWGTICDDIWGSSNAQVVCNQLGFNYSAAIAATRAHYGEGSGPILLDNVDCEGDEERVLECVHEGVENHNCGHHEDAGVYCQPIDEACMDGSIQLAGNREVKNEGRVEICYRGQWGTICDDQWDNNNAAVVCRQLGYSEDDAIPVSRALYGHGIGEIYYDDVDCTGHETNISDCRHRGLLIHNCQHSEDAGVLCKPNNESLCHNGDIRLVDGRYSTEGRVEFCFNNRWGTVCDDLFGNVDARVICRQLGFPSDKAYAQVRASFGEGKGPIFLDNLNCIGNETMLLNCKNDGVGFHNCLHTEDSSVICKASEEVCSHGDLRLMDGDFPNEGRVEICMDNHWGSVCNSLFDVNDATVICNQLGYTNGNAIPVKSGFFEDGLGMVWLEKLECVGNESSILDCTRGKAAYSSCRHTSDVSVICPVGDDDENRCTNGDVRLVNGSVPNEGLVEICFNGRWGTICEDDWDVQDAMVLCNQLGFPGDSVIAVGKSIYSTSSGPIFVDSLSCKGTESSITQCFNHSTLGSHNCMDSDGHAGVLCPARVKLCDNGDIRLVDGGTLLEGRVEMCYNSRWGTVCDTVWDNRDASVVCKQVAAKYGLEYTDFINAIAVSDSAFGGGDGPIFLKDIRCVGSEETLLDCRGAEVSIHECNDHRQDAGVYCGLQPCDNGAMRLSAGLPGTNNTGRVEMCIHNVWSAVCDRMFDDVSAQLVCTQLGLPSKKALSIGGDFFGHGHLMPTWSVQYTCNDGGCSLQPVKMANGCSHVGIFCEQLAARCTTGHVRLVGGANSSEGRVEVCLDGHWGKVCDDSWDDNAASVVCGQLKLPTLGAKAVMGSSWGSSPSLDFILDDVKCTGSESELLDCQSSSVLTHNCLHTEEAGVTCHGKVYTPSTDTQPTDTVDVANSDDSDEEEMYTSSQVAAIIVPILLVMLVILVSSVVGMWLILQWRKRSVKQSDQFPIIAGEGISQFNEFSNSEEDTSLDKTSGTTTTI